MGSQLDRFPENRNRHLLRDENDLGKLMANRRVAQLPRGRRANHPRIRERIGRELDQSLRLRCRAHYLEPGISLEPIQHFLMEGEVSDPDEHL